MVLSTHFGTARRAEVTNLPPLELRSVPGYYVPENTTAIFEEKMVVVRRRFSVNNLVI